MRITFTMALYLTTSVTFAITVPNGTFEEGDGSATGWELDRGRGEWASPGFDSAHCLSVSGDGEDDAAWLSDDIPFVARNHYQLRFMAKRSKGSTGGSAVTGSTFMHRDLRLTEEWKPYSFVFRVPDDITSARLRFGQWCLNGTAYFDCIELLEAEPLYTPTLSGVLGMGESVNADRYTARHLLGSHFSNSARFLDSATARFNSNRWLFEPGLSVTYLHHLADTKLTAATLSVNLNHHISGSCVVMASVDGENWADVGVLSSADTSRFPLPESVFPAEQLYVRLTGEVGDDGQASFQINRYELEASLSDSQPPANGETVLYTPLVHSPVFSMSVKPFPRPRPGVDYRYFEASPGIIADVTAPGDFRGYEAELYRFNGVDTYETTEFELIPLRPPVSSDSYDLEKDETIFSIPEVNHNPTFLRFVPE